jgi:predicted nucleic acid-binding protein
LDLDLLMIVSKIVQPLEMHDKIILATAISYNAQLITKDREIEKSNLVEVVW